jgi:hypothetical protein
MGACALACVLISGCATETTQMPTVASAEVDAEAIKQADLALKLRMEDQARVMGVAQRLMIANAELCPASKPSLGVTVATINDFPKPIRSAAQRGMSLSSAPQVTWTMADGAADKAGLKVGETIVAVADWKVTPDSDGARELARRLANPPADEMKLTVAGPGGPREVVLHPVLSCGYAVAIADQDEPNARADGQQVIVNRGMLRFVKSDDELALVLAHELAHDSEQHIRAKSTNATTGLIAGGAVDVLFALGGINTQGAFMKAGQAAGAGYHSAEFEAEADYVGVYYMARAGYRTDGIEDFWRRFAAEHSNAIFVKSDHPTTPARYLSIARAREEIEAKRKSGGPLKPERKKPDSAPDPNTIRDTRPRAVSLPAVST